LNARHVSNSCLRVGLVGCVKKTLTHRAPAEDLYVSPLFVGRRRYVEGSCDRWFILSAEHGLVTPERELEPYDETAPSPSARSTAPPRRWSWWRSWIWTTTTPPRRASRIAINAVVSKISRSCGLDQVPELGLEEGEFEADSTRGAAFTVAHRGSGSLLRRTHLVIRASLHESRRESLRYGCSGVSTPASHWARRVRENCRHRAVGAQGS
jgi:hypothetical protein